MGKTLASDIPKYVVELPPPITKVHKYKCDFGECGKLFTKESRLKMHVVTHSSEKPFKCSFEGCESSYYRQNHLKRHEATRHLIMGGDYICVFEGCFASFETSKSLYFHNKRRHNVKKYNCSFCVEMFSKKFQLKEHEYSHTSIPPFECKINDCSEKFTIHALLKSHQRLHLRRQIDGEEQVQPKMSLYKCDMCEDVFDKWSNFISHKKQAHKNVTCPTCGKTVVKSHMRTHLKVHEPDKESFPCTEEGCSRVYSHAKNLANHKRQAHEGRSFQCEVCKRKLSTKQKLDLHIEVIHRKSRKIVTVKKPKTLDREKLLTRLDGSVDFEISRRGPGKGVKLLSKSKSTIAVDSNEEKNNMRDILEVEEPCYVTNELGFKSF